MQCHWYGKDYRPGRKLGHINVDLTDDRLDANVDALASDLDDVHQELLQEAVTRARESGVTSTTG